MIVVHVDCHSTERYQPPDRRLRNRIILANAIVWVAIIVLIRLVFF